MEPRGPAVCDGAAEGEGGGAGGGEPRAELGVSPWQPECAGGDGGCTRPRPGPECSLIPYRASRPTGGTSATSSTMPSPTSSTKTQMSPWRPSSSWGSRLLRCVGRTWTHPAGPAAWWWELGGGTVATESLVVAQAWPLTKLPNKSRLSHCSRGPPSPLASPPGRGDGPNGWNLGLPWPQPASSLCCLRSTAKRSAGTCPTIASTCTSS